MYETEREELVEEFVDEDVPEEELDGFVDYNEHIPDVRLSFALFHPLVVDGRKGPMPDDANEELSLSVELSEHEKRKKKSKKATKIKGGAKESGKKRKRAKVSKETQRTSSLLGELMSALPVRPVYGIHCPRRGGARGRRL